MGEAVGLNTAFLFTGIGGILIGLVMLFYIISILHSLEIDVERVSHLLKVAEAKEAVKVVSISFGVYSIAMIAGGIGLIYDSPMIDEISRFIGGFSLISFLYFLHIAHSKSVERY